MNQYVIVLKTREDGVSWYEVLREVRFLFWTWHEEFSWFAVFRTYKEAVDHVEKRLREERGRALTQSAKTTVLSRHP